MLTPSCFLVSLLRQPFVADSSLVRGSSFYCLLMEQAAVSVVTPESIQPIGVWSIVRSETALVDVVTSKE